MNDLKILIVNDGKDVILSIRNAQKDASGRIVVEYEYDSFDIIESYTKDIDIFSPEQQMMIKHHFGLD